MLNSVAVIASGQKERHERNGDRNKKYRRAERAEIPHEPKLVYGI
jgi:hypothetical protein